MQKSPNKIPKAYREQTNPIDLVRQFEQDQIDIRPLLESRKVTLEVEGSLNRYNGEFGDKQKKHLLNRTVVGYAKRHLDDLKGLTLEESIDKLFTQHSLGEPINNYYGEISPSEYQSLYGNRRCSAGRAIHQ